MNKKTTKCRACGCEYDASIEKYKADLLKEIDRQIEIINQGFKDSADSINLDYKKTAISTLICIKAYIEK